MSSFGRKLRREVERKQTKGKNMQEAQQTAGTTEASDNGAPSDLAVSHNGATPTQTSAETIGASEGTTERRDFTKAEFKRLRDLASVANRAMTEYNGFLDFLKEQHEIEADDPAWQIGEKGFERQVSKAPEGSSE
jgi:hypothetical protein